MTHNSEDGAGHRVSRDSRGYYCLDCSWPGADFKHQGRDAEAHKAETRGTSPGRTEASS